MKMLKITEFKESPKAKNRKSWDWLVFFWLEIPDSFLNIIAMSTDSSCFTDTSMIDQKEHGSSAPPTAGAQDL